jgi:hypothetical protein
MYAKQQLGLTLNFKNTGKLSVSLDFIFPVLCATKQQRLRTEPVL